MVHIIQYLETKSKSFLLILGFLLVLLIGAIDYLIPLDISSIFYLIPVALTSWFIGEKSGIFISLFCTLCWVLLNNLKTGFFLGSYLGYWNAFVRLAFYLTVTYLLSELRISRNREIKLARTDEITGVANKKLFIELANLELKRSRRYGHPFTVTYIDLDNFKRINDNGGYKIGDIVLKNVAQTIKNTVRETDIVARLGGDEFAILLPGLAYEPAQIVIDRVQVQLLETMDKNLWPVTFSIGAITFINQPESADEIIEKIDYLMYCIKNNGKNSIEHITEA